MKIIRINKGKTVPLSIRFLSAVIAVLLIIKVVDWAPEPLSIILALIIASILPGIWFATDIIIIDEDHKKVFDGVWTMGKRIGSSTKYDSIEKIFINRVKTKQTMYSLANKQNVITDHEYRAYLKLSDGRKYFLLSHPVEQRIEQKVTKIRKKLAIN